MVWVWRGDSGNAAPGLGGPAQIVAVAPKMQTTMNVPGSARERPLPPHISPVPVRASSPGRVLLQQASTVAITTHGHPSPPPKRLAVQQVPIPVAVPVTVSVEPVVTAKGAVQQLPPQLFQQQQQQQQKQQQQPPTQPLLADNTAIEKTLLARINGVVSEMERELSEDLVMCVNSPLRELRRPSPTADVGDATIRGGPEGHDSTVDWIDKQIWAIEHRREACELRQAHLADLRRIVADGQAGGLPEAAGSGASVGGSSTLFGGSTDEELVPAGPAKPTRLSVLEQEHFLLKKQVECEREELLRVREALEGECTHRLIEVKNLAEVVDIGKKDAWAMQELATERIREAEIEVQAFQEELAQAEAACMVERQASLEANEAQVQTVQELRLLEENSRIVLGDCRALQAKVQELQSERRNFMESLAEFEEERQVLQTRIRLLEEQQRLDVDIHRHALTDRGLEPLAVDRKDHLIQELETELQHSLAHGESHAAKQTILALEQQVSDIMVAEAGAEQRARLLASADSEQRLRSLITGAETLRAELADTHALRLKESRSREEAERKLEDAGADLVETRGTETRERLTREATERDLERVQAHAEERERKHQRTIADLDRLRSEHSRLLDDMASKQETTRVESDQRLQQRLAAERQHCEELEAKCHALEEEKRGLHCDLRQLQEAHEAEQQAWQELERKHRVANHDNQQLHADHRELLKAKESERRQREEAEKRCRSLADEIDQLKLERQRLQRERLADKWACEEAAKLNEEAEGDKDRLLSDLKKSRMELDQEQLAREEIERRYHQLLRDVERLKAEHQKLHSDKGAELQAREDAEKRHHDSRLDLDQLRGDHERLLADMAMEQRLRQELEQKHRNLEVEIRQQHREEKERLRQSHQDTRALDRQAYEEMERRSQQIAGERQQIHSEHTDAQEQLDKERLAREEVERTLRLLREEKEDMSGSIVQLKNIESQHRLAERSLRQARTELDDERGRKAQLEQQLGHFSVLQGQLDEERERVVQLEQKARETSMLHQRLKQEQEKNLQMEQHRERNNNLFQGQLEDERSRNARLEEQMQDFGLLGRKLEEERERSLCLQQRVDQLTQERDGKEQLLMRFNTVEQERDEERRRNAIMESLISDQSGRRDSAISRLEAQLVEESRTARQLEEDLTQAKMATELLQQDAEDALQKADDVKQKLEMTWKEKLEQAQREIETLKRGDTLGTAASERPRLSSDRQSITFEWDRPSILETAIGSSDEKSQLQPGESQKGNEAGDGVRDSFIVPEDGVQDSFIARDVSQLKSVEAITKRPSLWAEPPEVRRPSLMPMFSTGSGDFLDSRVQEAKSRFEDAQREANLCHGRSIEAQLRAAIEAGGGLAEALEGWDGRNFERDRQAAASVTSSSMRELQALCNEAQMGEELELVEQLETYILRCKEELELFGRPSPLAGLPEPLLEAVVDIYANGGEANAGWDGGFSPMHWCAQHGRRDLIEFIHQQVGGQEMVNSRDEQGRTPVFYAERGERLGLAQYLREEVGASVPAREVISRRPNIGGIPARYFQVLQQVESQGWHSVKWKDGFTMLHWAAERGYEDLCMYLIELGADPMALDSQGRTAVDSAVRSGHSEVANAIREASNHQRNSVYISAFPSRGGSAGRASS